MNKVDVDTATIVGLWVGICGFVTGLAGIGLTLYFFYNSNPNIFVLTLSGWGAALLITFASVWVGSKLVKLLTSQMTLILNLKSQTVELEIEKQRLILISEFLASKSIKVATPRKPKEAANQQEQGNEN